MKATGIVRRVDDLGRIVLPKELRQTMGIRTGDPMEIYTDADSIILRKYAPGCAFCGSVDGVRHIHDVPMCAICANNMQMLYRTAAGRERMKVFGDPRAKAKVRRLIVGATEDAIMAVTFLAVGCLLGWVMHVIFTALGVA